MPALDRSLCLIAGGNIDFTGGYGADADCTWNVQCAGTYSFQHVYRIISTFSIDSESKLCIHIVPLVGSSDVATLSFSSFATEENFDYVRVDTNGDDITETDLHGASVPATITGGSSMLIQFQSDGSAQADGFFAVVACHPGEFRSK